MLGPPPDNRGTVDIRKRILLMEEPGLNNHLGLLLPDQYHSSVMHICKKQYLNVILLPIAVYQIELIAKTSHSENAKL